MLRFRDSILTTALLVGSILISCGNEEKNPEELLVAYITATRNSDFDSVVGSIHSSALEVFKEHTQNVVETAAEDYSEEAVLAAFYGLEPLGELEALPIKEYWVYVMSNVYSIYSENDSASSIDVIGQVKDGELLHLLCLHDGDLPSTEKVENLRSPNTVTFRKEAKSCTCGVSQ